MTSGYLYCFSNSSFGDDVFKIGMTERTPEERTKELFTTGVPTPFKIEFAKKVNDCKQKEKLLHKLLAKHLDRVNPKREFFRGSLEDIKEFFDLMDGEWWEREIVQDDGTRMNVGAFAGFTETELLGVGVVAGCRKMAKCFTNGQRIRHAGTAGTPSTWTGTYNSSIDKIEREGEFYKTPSQFAESHYKTERPDRVQAANGWKECKCEINGDWISTFNLPHQSD